MMKDFKQLVVSIIGLAVFFFAISYFSDRSREQSRKNVLEEEMSLQDMSIPPVLSDHMKDPTWSIRYWLGVDAMHGDCRIAHEYMDDGILEKTTSGRRGRSWTHNIFEYLGSCKRSAQRAIDLVSPRVKKWCHYRSTDTRLDELCTEWEKNGESYISTLEDQYKSTEARFRQLTGSAYDEQLENL